MAQGEKAEGEISGKRSACTPQRVNQPLPSHGTSSPGTQPQAGRAGPWAGSASPHRRVPTAGPRSQLRVSGCRFAHLTTFAFRMSCWCLTLALVAVLFHSCWQHNRSERPSLAPYGTSPCSTGSGGWPGLWRADLAARWKGKWAGVAFSRPQFVSQLSQVLTNFAAAVPAL